jgi:Uma2 family endonuclease
MTGPEIAEKLLTAEEFYLLEDPIEGGKMELVRGRMVYEMPVSGKHGTRAADISYALLGFTRAHSLGKVGLESGFKLEQDPDTVRAPDVYFVSTAMLGPGGIPEEGYIPFVPTLAVEVVSPNDLDWKVMEKVDDYLAAGVPRVWVVRPKRQSVTVYRSGGLARVLRIDDVLTSDDAGFDAEGFTLPVREIVA